MSLITRAVSKGLDSIASGETCARWLASIVAEPVTCPEKVPAERWIAAGLFMLSCLYLSLFLRNSYMDPDEGIILQGAQRILEGQVLYRDFFSFLTPGSYYFLALIFRIFGSSMAAARGVLVVYGGLFSAFTYWMARRTCSRWVALVTVYLAMITCLPWRFVSLHNWDSTLWACLAIYCAVLLAQKPHWGWAFGLGSFMSLTFMFEQSKGAGLLAGLAAGFVCLHLLGYPSSRFHSPYWMALAAGLLWPFVITFGYFASQHALRDMIADWIWPLQHYTQVNFVPYGYQDWSDAARESMFASGPWLGRLVALLAVSPCFVMPVLPIISILLLLHWMFAKHHSAVPLDRAACFVILCCSLAGLLLSVVFVRANATHFVYLTPLTYLVLAWLMDGKAIRNGIVQTLRPILTGLGILAFTALGLALLIANRNADWTMNTRRGVLRTPGADSVVPYIQSHLAPGAGMVVYPYLPLYYYLTATTNPTRFDYLQPGLHTQEQGQETIREMAGDRSAAVLFEPSFVDRIPTSWPNTPLRFLAYDPVADYILGHYHSCATLTSAAERRFAFMVRNGIDCPP